ncbi:MAG TPA: VTT domain-containing protein [Vicinamibacterales bacterium]
MRSLSRRLVGLFASPLGVFVLAALDGTLFFSLPFGIDAVVIILSARLRGTAWIVPLLATAGSVTGAAVTFWIGVKIGDAGLERYVPPRRLEKIRERIRGSGAVALAALSIIPPPFPFTPFVLAAGALDVRTSTFFTTFVTCRLARFGLEALLAVWYGRSILRWLDSQLFQDIVGGCIVLTVILTTISFVRVIRSTKPTRRSAAA